jgi:hypothetical protein
MAATFSTATKSNVVPKVMTGSFTSDSTAGDHTVYFDEHIYYFECILNANGTAPDKVLKHSDNGTETVLITGGTGVYSDEADSVGVAIDLQAGGKSTVIVRSEVQTNSGVNHWIAYTKPYGV